MRKIGETVQALDDDFEGTIVTIKDKEIGVEDADGFVLYFSSSELIPAISNDIRRELSYVPNAVINEKEESRKKVPAVLPKKQRSAPPMEVDLHIHNLVDKHRGMSNYEMLNLQLETAGRQVEFAIKNRIPKLIFIHGVGEGVLREELYTLLRRYDNLKFYDADFQKYGVGATEVYIYQNV